MRFDLPRDTEAFQRHAGWDFTLSHESSDFQVSMQEVAGVSEEEELSLFKKIVVQVIGKKEEAVRIATDSFFEDFIRKWNREQPISREEFTARLRVSSISIEGDRSASLEFEDDRDMFWGHAIIVSFDREGKITHAELSG